MTKFLKAALAATVATSFFAAPAMAQEVGDFQANATIVKPLTMTITDSMEFGSITLQPAMVAAATVSVAWNPATSSVDRTCDDGTGNNIVCGGTPLVPNIAFTGGVGSQTVSISYTAPTDLAYDDGTAVHLLPFTLDSPLATLALSNGAGDFYVNGTISVPPSSPEGAYTGTVDVTADYN
jgi:hypothetical protein